MRPGLVQGHARTARVWVVDWMLGPRHDFDDESRASIRCRRLRGVFDTRTRGSRMPPEPATVLSGLADSRTPGLPELLRSRQASLAARAFPTALTPILERGADSWPPNHRRSSSAVQPTACRLESGCTPNYGPSADAGLDKEHVFRTAGINAAKALGTGPAGRAYRAGRQPPISCIVDGDPLADVADDTLKIVGVVRNGRFYSAIGLIEKAQARPRFVE